MVVIKQEEGPVGVLGVLLVGEVLTETVLFQ